MRVSWLAAAAIVAVAIGAAASGIELAGAAGNRAARTQGGEPWRLVTYALVHAGGWHVAINALALVVVGTFAERRLGGARTAAVLAGATVAGGAASLLASPYAIIVGASAAASGLCGALAAALVRARPAAWREAAPLAAVLVWGGVLAATTDRVDHAAHAAGLVAGAAIALAPRAALAATVGAAALVVALAPAPLDVRARAAQVIAIEARYDALVDAADPRAIEAEVLAPLRAARFTVDARLPPRERRLARALAAYLDARVRALSLYVAYLDTRDPSLLPRIEAADAAARAAGESLE